MAPLPQLHLLETRNYRSHSYSHSSGGGAPIGGGVIAAIVALVIIIFICVFIHEYRKASNLRRNVPNPIPIPTGKIFKKAALIALTFGIVGLCCAECVADVDTPVNNGGGGGAQVVDQQMGVTPMMQAPPMPSVNEGMDWTPVNSAAQDGVQG